MSQSATLRTLEILEFLSSQSDGTPLSEVASALAIPKSVAHRLLGQLVGYGYVQQDIQGGRYGLTLKLTLLGLRHLAGTGVNDIAQPILDKLAAMSGELARLAIVEGRRMHWVAKAQGARYGLRYDPEAGHDVVLHATAVGKAWLSTLPDRVAVSIFEETRIHMPGRGPNAIMTVAELRKALAETRDRGYGLAIEEGEPGMSAIAAVVRSSSHPDAPVVGTLSLAGPSARFDAIRRQVLALELVAAARELSAVWPTRRAPDPAVPELEEGSFAHAR